MVKYTESDLEPVKFRGKYRLSSARLKNWNYAENGYYFVTVCTKNRECYFGNINNKKMELSVIGKMTGQCWKAIPNHFPFVVLDEFVVMPNHIHGILVINKNKNAEMPYGNKVETQNLASLRIRKPKQKISNQFGPQSRNLASIIRGFKIGVTKFANHHNINFCWQSRFYDHIIRNEQSLNRIRQYIIKNPLKWVKDRNNPENLYA